MRRELFERGLQDLQNRILNMGEQADRALRLSVEALKSRQPVLAEAVIKNDQDINRERFGIEEAALTLIATQGPVAHDLRLIAAVIHISSELERMADHAKGIARLVEIMQKDAWVEIPDKIPEMAAKCSEMLRETLEAIRNSDAAAARRIAYKDDELDLLYEAIHPDLLQIMTRQPELVNPATHLLWVAHNLERFGDRVVNICERIIFVATGEMVEINQNRNG
ncbi:MAG TPA: phosphate signaling complex protein PhoU [Chloroflexia bacterium]|nr:phosphate signaling complex protein PhoU [Chloroflexia bacterium]